MRIDNQGIEIEVPTGWEAAISGDRTKVASLPVVHLSTTALGPDRGDFGSGAVEDLGDDDAFVAIVEYGDECAGTELFARQGLPRRLRARQFNRRALQRTLDGQAGQQVFFTEAGRPFCLYVVLGRDHDIEPLVERVNAALDAVRIT